MTTRILGPTGSRRRRRFLIGPILFTALLALFLTAGAQAVHDTGVFQMDGNAQTSVQSNPAALEDWDLICKANPSTCSFAAGVTPPAATTTSDVSAHVADATAASIFTGGGSKDGSDIPAWKHKDGSVPDKDNLLHSFAARYKVPPSASCPVAGGVTNCELLYFGSDRFDNSGDATQAFWFFQNKVTLNANGTFSGVHKDGDLLVVSDFSNGGDLATINIYKWLAGGLSFVDGGEAARCDSALAGPDPFCGIVNPVNPAPGSGGLTTSPWTFLDKSGNSNYLNGELFEAGLNLSHPDINLAGECFSSFLSETRASTSTTSVLKDFVLGQFAVCTPTLTTVPSPGAGGEVSPGDPVTDLFRVQGQGILNPPTPTGNVTFFRCGPIAAPAVCDTGGTQVGSAKALVNSSPPAGEAEATSDAVNTPGAPLLPGRYCFRAVWPGDANYTGGPFTHFGTGDAECFIVRQIPTSTVTTPSDGSGVALVSPVAFGTSLFDKAVVTGTAAGGTPPGNVNFFICDPDQVTGAAGAETCAAGTGTALGNNPRPLSADAGSSPPSSSALSSPAVTANKSGVWCFRATYVPTGNTYLTSSDNSHGECVTVNKAPTTTVTTPSNGSGVPLVSPVAFGTTLFDKAVVTGVALGGSPTGSVDFFVCDPSQVTGAAGAETCAAGTGTALGGNPRPLSADAGSSPPSSSVLSSPGVLADKSGVWCFRATYNPSGTTYLGSSDNSHGECVTVGKQPTTTVTTPSDGSGIALVSPVPLGTSLFDKAVVTGVAAGGNPTGSVDFFICDPSQVTGAAGAEVCAGGTALGGNPRGLSADAGSNPPSSSVLSSPGVAADKAGVWCFRATYNPSGTTYVGSSDNSHGECVTVSKAPTTTVTTPSANTAVPVNTQVTDHALVTGSSADSFPTGSVKFFICNPFEVTGAPGSEACAIGGTQIGSVDVTPVIGSSPPQTEATSGAITATAVGVWCFRAEYTPGGANGGNYLPSNDATHGECFLVQDSTSTSTEQDWLPNDSATVTSTGDTNLDGTLSFTLYSGNNCGATSGSILIPAEQFTLADVPSPATRSTSNSSFEVKTSQTVSWKVVFDSSNANVGDSSHCEVSSLVITN